jgi:hypothetical protein
MRRGPSSRHTRGSSGQVSAPCATQNAKSVTNCVPLMSLFSRGGLIRALARQHLSSQVARLATFHVLQMTDRLPCLPAAKDTRFRFVPISVIRTPSGSAGERTTRKNLRFGRRIHCHQKRPLRTHLRSGRLRGHLLDPDKEPTAPF